MSKRHWIISRLDKMFWNIDWPPQIWNIRIQLWPNPEVFKRSWHNGSPVNPLPIYDEEVA